MTSARKGAVVDFIAGPRRKPWRARWLAGPNRYESRCFKTEKEAWDFLSDVKLVVTIDEAEASLTRRKLGIPGELKTLVPRYYNDLRQKGRSGTHWRNVRSIFLRACADLKWEVVSDISKLQLKEFQRRFCSTLKDAGHSYIGMIQTFIRRMKDDQYAIDPEALEYRVTVEKIEDDDTMRDAWIEEEQREFLEFVAMGKRSQRALVAALSPEQLAVRRANDADPLFASWRQALLPPLHLMLRWGPRPKEASLVEVRNWDPRTAILTLPGEITKNRKTRHIYVDRLTASLLTQSAGRRLPQERLFLTRQGIPWTTNSFYKLIRRILQDLGIRGSQYWCRHTACTELCARFGGDLRRVGNITGHKQLKVLEGYLHARRDKDQVVAASYDQEDQAGNLGQLYGHAGFVLPAALRERRYDPKIIPITSASPGLLEVSSESTGSAPGSSESPVEEDDQGEAGMAVVSS